jgi:FKBP-type peptidyl-prolyl cis-trans isomerase FklB
MKQGLRVTAAVCVLLAASVAFAGGAIELKTKKDRISYALGQDMGMNLKRSSVEVDPELLLRGLKDKLSGGKTLLTDEEVRRILTELERGLLAKQQERMNALGDKAANQAFLEKNKARKGVKVLPSGLQYRIIRKGSGKSPKATDTVTIDYRGTLIDGTEFDSSYRRGHPATMRVNEVIKGWTEALQLMKTGATWQIVVPANLAYGASGRPGIPKNATLIFEIKLLSIKEMK